jgi:uncharacterized protein YjeT (DUF2065 family)
LNWELLLTAGGLALILEGLPYFLSPGGVKKMASRLLEIPSSALRLFGLAGMILGLVLIYLGRLV